MCADSNTVFLWVEEDAPWAWMAFSKWPMILEKEASQCTRLFPAGLESAWRRQLWFWRYRQLAIRKRDVQSPLANPKVFPLVMACWLAIRSTSQVRKARTPTTNWWRAGLDPRRKRRWTISRKL